MIVIVSEDFDHSTSLVAEWLLSKKEAFVRINFDAHITADLINIGEQSEITIQAAGKSIPLRDIKSVWFRRGNFTLRFPDLSIDEDFIFKNAILKNVNNELTKARDYINYKLLEKKVLGNYHGNINKLIVLDVAKASGLKIPHTLITTKKDSLLRFKEQHENIICKAVSEAIQFEDPEVGVLVNYTQCVTDETIMKLGDTFPLSLFQNKVEKKYELRIFYLDGEFYPMAIFSQLDEQTSLDFRRYNYSKPNRTIPYNLPERIKDGIRAMMKSLQLNTGSIDMAVDRSNEYIFFEVNPVGQYGMTSAPCNYHLDRRIAEYLTRKNEAEQTPKHQALH